MIPYREAGSVASYTNSYQVTLYTKKKKTEIKKKNNGGKENIIPATVYRLSPLPKKQEKKAYIQRQIKTEGRRTKKQQILSMKMNTQVKVLHTKYRKQ